MLGFISKSCESHRLRPSGLSKRLTKSSNLQEANHFKPCFSFNRVSHHKKGLSMLCNGIKHNADADVTNEEKRINQLPSLYSKTACFSIVTIDPAINFTQEKIDRGLRRDMQSRVLHLGLKGSHVVIV